jgi:hypothetical protein
MTDASEVVHVAWSVSRAESVRDALQLQGRDERVIALTHALSVGPINPFDPDARRAWFAVNLRSEDGPWEELTDAEKPWTEATAPGVHPVYWVCMSDAGEHACFLEFVSRMAGRPFDVVDVTGFDFESTGHVRPVWSLGQLRPEEIVAAGLSGLRRAYTRPESAAAIADWARLRRENAPLRIVHGGRLVSAPLTHFDGLLTKLARRDRELLIGLVARVLRHLETETDQPGQGCGYELLFARILTLGETGVLDVTGRGPGMRDFEVRQPVAGPPP